MKKKNKKMVELTANYESFIKDKEINKNAEQLFNKAIKKAASKNVKPRGLK